MDKVDTLKRLKTIEGHVRGIERMVENDTYCIDLIRQIQAVQASLATLNSTILDNHLHSCLITAVRGKDMSERERVLQEIAEVYRMAARSLKRPQGDEMETRTYTVPNISCGHCVHTIQTELRDVIGVARVEVDQAQKHVAVEFEPPATDEGIRTALAEINYPVVG